MEETKEKFQDVYKYILAEENKFKVDLIPLGKNWNWNMFEHIERSYHLKNSQFYNSLNQNDFSKPFNNIIIPIANVNYRTEGFDVKDVELYVDDADEYHLSLLTKKFYERWAIKYSIDTAIDESVESYFDYGLTLVKNVNEERPEVVALQTIAFCDQTDIMSGPICIKHQYSIDQLLEMKGWDKDVINEAILNARFQQTVANNQTAKTPGKYIEVYELHGTFPKTWLKTDDYSEPEDKGAYSSQIHIVTYYQSNNQRKGLCLFKGEEPVSIFKALKREPIFGRACGRGGVEELFHPQIWTNSSEIHLQQMLEATSKVILQTQDAELASRNKLSNIKHGQILKYKENSPVTQVMLQPINKPAFDGFINKWEQVGRTIGSASDPQLGLNPTSGTPLGTTQIVTAQGEGMHEYRKGKIAIFWGEIHRDWIIPQISKDLAKGDKWLTELSMDELTTVADRMATTAANEKIKRMVLSGKTPTKDEQTQMTALFKENFMKGGKNRFMEITKGELSKIPLDVKFTIAGKQANLADKVAKLNNVFRGIFANPQILQMPGMGELFNQILEASGLSPIDFTALTQQQPQQPQQVLGQPNQTNQTNQPTLSPIQQPNLATNQPQ